MPFKPESMRPLPRLVVNWQSAAFVFDFGDGRPTTDLVRWSDGALCRSERTRVFSSSRLTGLVRKSSAPAETAFSMSPALAEGGHHQTLGMFRAAPHPDGFVGTPRTH